MRNATTSTCFATSAIGIGASLLLASWMLMWRRHEAAGNALHARMREIEWQTNMRKNIYLSLLKRWRARCDEEDWKRLRPSEQEALAASYKPLPFPSATAMLNAAAILSIAAWMGLIAVKRIERSLW